MASAFFGLNRGQTEFTGDAAGTQGITESATTTGSTDIEIRIDLTKNWTQAEMVIAIDALKEWMIKNRSKFLVG